MLRAGTGGTQSFVTGKKKKITKLCNWGKPQPGELGRVWHSARGTARPGPSVPFVFLHLHPDGVELPLAPALRVRVGDGLNLPGREGK